jgi:hypothetical protein
MNEFEQDQVIKAFNRCFGLQNALKTSENDKVLRRGAIESLAYQSGLKKEFIENHLTEILSLNN